MKNIVEMLIKKGVNIPNPATVFISDEVNIDRISGENVTIYGGCKIFGEKSLIMKNSQIGYEAPVTLENTFLGENTKLMGGFFNGAVFAGDNTFGSGAHVRNGTILEEEANAAHTVGLKQTILFPFVTLGSLINFCDCFMAGGTNRKDHSEVGSSFIHFNYTPHQDKATPSMMGDVHHGVMLNSRPIFLGGQGGLVGPVRIAYGCLSAAGSIIRKNELRNDRLLLGGTYKEISIQRDYNSYKNISHIFNNNIYYIAGLIALKSWYKYIRPLFIYDNFSKSLVKGMQDKLNDCIIERAVKLKEFCRNLEQAKEKLLKEKKYIAAENISNYEKVLAKMQLAEEVFDSAFEKNEISDEGEAFIKSVEKRIMIIGKKYINVIKSIEPVEQSQGSTWLFNIERRIVEKLLT
ncbi:MAG: protein GlmU [Desulfobacterales bacterium RIFOXYA12_FULL_46_15]|nr:MAG: protein GlmU [Desulfobacterales bacterium RIFOXYA12_FULL_46_15]